MIGLGRAVDRGLYRVGRVREDWSPFAWFVAFVAAVLGLAAAIWATVEEYTAHDWHVFGVYVLSEVLRVLPFGPDKTKKIRDLDGEVLVWTIEEITRHSYILDLRDRMLGDALSAAQWGGGIGAGLLIGTVLVAHIVHWRNDRKRRRGAGEKRAAPASRCWIGRRFNSTLRLLPAFVLFVRKAVVRYAVAGRTGRGNIKPPVDNHHADDALDRGLGQGRGFTVPPAAWGEPMVGPLSAARSKRQGRPNAAEAPLSESHLRLDQRPDGEAHLVPRETPASATSPPAPTVSPPAALENSTNSRRSEPTSRMPHWSGQESHEVRVPQGGEVAPLQAAQSQENEAAARDDGSEDAASSAPKGERAATLDETRRPPERPPRVSGPLGARKKRRKASQDFY